MSGIETLKVVGLKEHFVTAALLAAWEALEARRQDPSLMPLSDDATGHCLADLGSTCGHGRRGRDLPVSRLA